MIRLVLRCLLLMLPVSALSQGVRFDSSVTTAATNVPPGAQAPLYTVPYAKVTVCAYTSALAPCATPSPVYSDRALAQLIAQPLRSDATGRYGFWIASGVYQECVTTQSGSAVGCYALTLNSSPGSPGPVGPSGTLTNNTGYSTPNVTTNSINSRPLTASEVNYQAYQINRAASQDYAANTAQLATDGNCFPYAAPTYSNVYISDFSLHILRRPQSTTVSCIDSIVTKFLADVVTPSRANPTFGPKGQSQGGIPIAINADGSTFADCSAWDDICLHESGDGWIFTPLDVQLLFKLTGDTSQLTGRLATLETALDAVPRDSTTGLVQITKYVAGSTPLGSEWIPWAFHEKPRDTGLDAMGSAWFYADALAMQQLYAAVGNASAAATWAATAATMKSNMSTSSPLWDATDGAFFAATGQNKQPDNMATALACHYGLATVPQCTAFGSYLIAGYAPVVFTGTITSGSTSITAVSSTTGLYVGQELNGAGISGGYVITAISGSTLTMSIAANASATETITASGLFKYGYMRQSNVNWATVGYIAADGSYNLNNTEIGAGCYQDAYWSPANLEAAEVLYSVSPVAAQQMLSDYTNGPDPTMEFWSDSLGCARQNGSTNNLESPAGMAAFAAEHPELVTESRQQLHTWVGGGYYTPDNTLGGPSLQVSGTITNNPAVSVNRYDSTVNGLYLATTGKIDNNNGFAWGIRNGSTKFSFFSRSLNNGSIGTDSFNVDPTTGALNIGTAMFDGNSSINGQGTLALLQSNSVIDTTGEHLINPAAPASRLVVDSNGGYAFQTAPATSGVPAWASYYAPLANTATPVSGCTPTGYIPVTINGTALHLAVCP